MSLKPYLLLTSILCFSIIIAAGCDAPDEERDHSPQITLGAEKLIENHLQELDGERIGLVMNPTARIGETHMLDSLLSLDVNITALFAPEHGFRGEAGAGDRIEDGIDQASGLPVFSLYGDTRKPTPEMLDEVDMLIFDMQDVGARFYTYIATLGLVLEAASESGTPVWVLDRPNPMGGDYVSGWMMDMEYESFVGPYPIPIAHGLTMGEIARMIVGEEWMDFEAVPDLRVIEMEGWSRDMIWPDTGLSWVAPSPNLPTFDHTYMYMGTVYYEGTTMSEGRGTDDPFLVIGDPGTDLSDDDFEQLNRLDGISISPYTFTPRSIPGVAPNPKHLDTQSFGIRIELESHDFDPIRTGLEIFRIVMNATPSAETNSFLYRLTGSDEIEQVLAGEVDPMTLDFGLYGFISDREPYLLYD